MYLPGTLWFFVILFSVQQVKEANADCNITSISSSTASSLLVKWNLFPGATSYNLEIKPVNPSNMASIAIPPLSSSTSEKLVQGLKPGQIYQVTIKVYMFNYMTCVSSQTAQTIPATSQITYSKAISSTSIRFEWSSAQGADSYILMVQGTFHNESHNLTFSTTSGQINNLLRSTSYNCYVYSSNAAGLGAKSLVKTIRTLVQPPDGVNVTELTQSSVQVTWQAVLNVLLYQVSVFSSSKPGLAPILRNVTGTTVNISSLEPCTTYTLGVASINMFLEPGESSNVTHTTASIPKVSIISLDYSCSSATASVSWDPVFGATSYKAVITDGQGLSLNCTSTATKCQITSVRCGELYTARVIAIANCESTSDVSYVFETAPCPPKSPQLYRECSTNVIVFSWNATNNTAYYRAMAVDSDGLVTECLTVDTSCYFTDTFCGKGYSFYVSSIYSKGLDCNSGNTQAELIRTAPCLPQNVHSAADCNSVSSAVTSWDLAEGAQSYTVEARGNRRDFYNCTTLNTTCTLTGLDCGESLSIWLVATDGDCTTDPVLGEVAETVPCIPQNVSAVETCSSNSATLSWLSSNGAIFYIGIAKHANGTIHSCTATKTECIIENLSCGETYDAYVVATNLQCNSSESQHVTLRTAPCAPDSVGVTTDCAGHHAIVTWQTLQPGGLDTATLLGEHGSSANCSTSLRNCTFANLLCGVKYNVSVTTNDGRCRSQPSTPIQIQSVPCDPQNATTTFQCDTNTANVTWAASAGANGYTVMATNQQQQPIASCHATGTSCQMTSLPCGVRLNVTIQADGATCNSSSQPTAVVSTAPCIPTHVTAALNCTSNTASISWYSALGATWYLVKAEGSRGYKTACNNTVPHCDIPNLQCGQEYSITVTGMNSDCTGPASQPVTLVSAPCPNTGVQARLDCRTNSALISWTPGNGSLSFNATLKSCQNAQTHSCFTNDTSCNISSLQCGQHYNISIMGNGQNCSTSSKTLVTLDTAPCVPTQVNVSLSCGSDTASVSWAASSGLVSYYIVTAEDDNGHTLTCNSSSTSCNISSLACGQAYNVSVTAMSADCTGQRSEVRRVNTAPCAPQNVSANVSCSSNRASVTWGRSQGAELYSVTASSANGLSANCISASTSCELALTCGESYSITVKAKGSNCSSANSAPVQLQTAPCSPLNIQSRMNCGNNTASVCWSPGNGALSFFTTMECLNGQTYTCRTNETRCDITNILCGQTCTVKVVAEGRSCNSSVETGPPIITAPCPNTGVQARLDCRSNSALISWTPGNGSLSFNATLQSCQNAQTHSCFTNGSSCNISSLQCGQHYNISITGNGQHCSTSSKTLVTLDTAPCVPTQLNVSLSCGSDTASVSWAASSGLVSYYIVTAEGDNGRTLTCNSSSTSCSISSLACGQAYNVSVTAVSGDCNGQRSEVLHVNTAPCAPQNVSANMSCSSNKASVTWCRSQGAELYSVTASSVNGLSSNCTSASTSCELALTCGESYSITVKAKGSNCSSANSAPVQLQTAPCPPLNIQSRINCGNNTASVCWSQGNGALSFLMTMECLNGQTYTCRTNGTKCDITNILCGQTCTVKVVGEGRSCNSSVETGPPIITAPCPNTDIQARLDCRSNSALISWTPGNGSLSFNATLQSCQNAQTHSCFTNGSSCNISSLPCGQHYNISVTGNGQYCSTSSKTLGTVDTAPCVPTQLNVSLSCGSDTASVSWAASSGLVSYYIATAEGDNGRTLTCNSSSTSCSIGSLACGQAYNVSVTAVSRDCNGQRSEVLPVNTAPCAPQNVSANMSCSSNKASVTWGRSQGAELYSVTASSVNGLSTNCTSAFTSCELALTCGESYSITVKAKGSNCTGAKSTPVQLQTAPCTPSNVLPVVDCVTNALVVSWTPSAGGQYYTATLQDSNGLSTTCQSTGSQCNVTGLRCGQLYYINVTASDNLCNSPPSVTVNANSVPCAARLIKAVLDCQLGSATVSWQYGAGAQGYAVSALSVLGNRNDCTSNSTNTYCELSNLQCGTEYSVTVQTLGSLCNASAQMNGSLIIGSCVPQHVKTQYSPPTAQLSWNVTNGASNFTALAMNGEGQIVTCETSNTSCVFPVLRCGSLYNISVTAHNSVCSRTTRTFFIMTEPCPPQNVKASINCGTLSAAVSWEPSWNALGYVAFLEGGNGHSTSCQTDQTYCSVPDLTCGTVYYIRVRAIGYQFNSSDSAGVNMTSAPCVSSSLSAVVDCATDSVLVSWSAIVGAVNYSVMALGSRRQMLSCSTNESHCNMSSLQCGQHYNLTLTSTNQQCEITTNTNVTFHSRPCAPLQPAVNKLCGNKMTVMSWDLEEGVEYYTARAISADGHQQICTSNNTVCSFSTLGCGETNIFTVTAHSGHCQSNASTPVYLTTDPCRPENVTAHVSCDSEVVEINWSNAKGASFYIVTATGNLGYVVDFNTSSTNLSMSLLCGQSYNVTIQGQNDLCDSPLSTTAVFRLRPCTPLHLQTYIQCYDKVGAVSWGSSDGGITYHATAVGNDGHTHLCVTNGTNCSWEDLHCGETYNVTVTANDSHCTSIRSNSTIIHMAPCVPQVLTPTLDCKTGVGALSWSSSSGAEIYEVVAVNGDGNTTAFSTNITSGFLSELICGQQYQITVRAINRQCRSAPSSPANLTTAPCVPQILLTEPNCLFNYITVLWNTSQGADSYLVVASGPEGPVMACNTTAQICYLYTLHCSSSYDVSVIAVNQQCNSSGSSITRINTVPCVPGHLQGSVNCTTGAVSLSWDRSEGAISYAAVAQSSGGYNSVCNSTGTTCVFSDLLCGMNYSLAVRASDGTCSTATSQPVVLSTVSCKPQNVSAQLTCDTNSAVVTWELSDHATHHFVQAVGTDGHHVNCSSSGYNCTLASLHCGQRYNLTVSALDGQCDNSNTFLSLQSAPCAPSSVQTSLHCDLHNGGVVSVSWVQASGAESYMATAVSNDGHSYSCNSTATSCSLLELQCGEIYNVSVYSLDHGCRSVKSTASQVQTAPCSPQNVHANVQCDSGSVLVSWSPAVDASQFLVALESQSTGLISFCNSTNTQCSITNLPCGQNFDVSVVAQRNDCQSQPSSGFHITSAPCTPQGVNGTLDCVTNSAWVSWNVDNGTESYTVLAVGEDGENSTCVSSNSTCHIPDLGCGMRFTFQVTASNAGCVSKPSNSFQLETAPCVLSSIVVEAECHSSVIRVRWQRAQRGNSRYIVTAEDQERSLLSCNSTTSSCNLTNVQCGKEYTIIVSASANQCSSLRSPPYKIRTAPCQPAPVQANADCRSKDVFVSWNPSYVAQSYLLTAVGRDGDLKTCNTSESNCTLTNLHCSSTYYVSVLASNENCTSLPSTNVTFHTVPCQPTNLTATIQCGNRSASLSWVGSSGAVAYVGLAQSENATIIYCETTHTSCSLAGLECGTVYNFSVQATDGTCNSSLSDPQTTGAAPCSPVGLRIVPRAVVNDTQILRASWSTANCPNSEYLLALKGSIQGNSQALFDITSYWTSQTFFEMPLLCGSSYSATIRARKFSASSEESAAVTGTTAPCAPLNVTFTRSSAAVAWTASIYATNYTVYGVTSSGRTKLCTTPQLVCTVNGFNSGHIVVTASNAAGESGDSMPVSVSARRRR